jgi:hypothetical protein
MAATTAPPIVELASGQKSSRLFDTADNADFIVHDRD